MRVRSVRVVAAATVCLFGLPLSGLPGLAGAAEPHTTAIMSIASNGAQSDRPSGTPSISGDGRIVAFASASALLVQGDTNNTTDIFTRDRRLGTIQRVSVNSQGVESRFTDPTKPLNADPVLSAEGRYVAFSSGAWNLVPGDTNELADIFVRDRVLNTTSRVSVGTGGAQGNGNSIRPAISANGRYVAFESAASNLIKNSNGIDLDTNGAPDIYVRDMEAGTTRRVSITEDGIEAPHGGYGFPAVSNNGLVAFHSIDPLVDKDLGEGKDQQDQNGIVDVYLRDVTKTDTEDGAIEAVSLDVNNEFGEGNSWDDFDGAKSKIAITPNGRWIAFESGTPTLVPGDTNAARDVFLRDREARTTERVSVSHFGRQLSGASRTPSVSDSGEFVTFVSEAADVVPQDANLSGDVFRRQRGANATTVRLSVTSGGLEADGASAESSLTGDGQAAVFSSAARNLVGTTDTNNLPDVFVRGVPLSPPPPQPVITAPGNNAVVQTAQVAFSGTAQGASAVRVIEGTTILGSATVTDGSWSLTATEALADGKHTVVAISSSSEGGDSEASPPRTFTVDTTGPTISVPVIQKPTQGTSTAAETVTVSGTADPGVQIAITEQGTQRGTTVASGTGVWSTAPLPFPEGPHTIVAVASDGNGASASSAPRTFTIDHTGPPPPVITQPLEGSTVYVNPVPMKGTAEPRATVYLYWESMIAAVIAADSAGNWTANVRVADGDNEVLPRARDLAGNFGEFGEPTTFVLQTDRAAPVLVFTTPSYHAYIPGTLATVDGAAQDDVVVTKVEVIIRTPMNTEVARPPVACTGCGTQNATWSASSLLPQGVYRVYATAYDGAGLKSATNYITIVRV